MSLSRFTEQSQTASDAADFPGAAAAGSVPGSLVFVGSKGHHLAHDWTRWWAWVPGTTSVTPTDQTARVAEGLTGHRR